MKNNRFLTIALLVGFVLILAGFMPWITYKSTVGDFMNEVMNEMNMNFGTNEFHSMDQTFGNLQTKLTFNAWNSNSPNFQIPNWLLIFVGLAIIWIEYLRSQGSEISPLISIGLAGYGLVHLVSLILYLVSHRNTGFSLGIGSLLAMLIFLTLFSYTIKHRKSL